MNKPASLIHLHPVWIAFNTIVTKEIIRFMRIWTQTLLPPAITMTLYFIIFGKLIGTQIKAIEGFTYIEYIVPGLVMMSIITNAYANTVSSFFLSKFNRSIEEMIVSPMPDIIILLGYTIGGALRGVLVGVVVTLIALLFTHLKIHSIAIVIIITVLSSMLFSLGGFINGIYAKRFDDISFIPTFVLTPLTYLGGVFYSIQQLPPFWRNLSMMNPILVIVDTFRYGMLGISDINVVFGLIFVVVLFLIIFSWAWWLLHKGQGIKT